MNTYTLQILMLVCLSCALGDSSKDPKAKSDAPKTEAPKIEISDKDIKEARSMVSEDRITAALKDKRYLMRQLKCVTGEGPCDAIGRKLKTYAPLVLRGSCPKCSPSEQRQIQQILSHVQRHYPKEWNKMIKQFSGAS